MTAILLAVASGILFALSLPPFNQEWLGWFALAPLLAAALRRGIKPLYAVGLGQITGFACGLVQVGVPLGYRAASLNYAFLPFVWIALVFGLTAALAAGTRPRLEKISGGIVWVLFAACAGVCVEWLTTYSPLPVGIALCQHRSVEVIQIAALTGIWGVSFLLWLVNAALVDAFLRRSAKTAPLALAAALWAVTIAYGSATGKEAALAGTPETIVAAVQDFNGVDAPPIAGINIDDLPDRDVLTRQAGTKGARLIVGSEEALGSAFQANDKTDAVAQMAQEVGASLVVGYEARAEPMPFNCAALVDESGETRGVHHKIRLFLGERQTIQAGNEATVAASPVGTVGLLICFDSCYTGETRQAVQKGAQVIALPNYDPPTPHAVLHNLHAALIPFRAVENHVAYVRADPNGQSQIISPRGKIVAESPMYRAEALVAPVTFGNGKGTFFTRWGDWLAYLCTGLTVTGLIVVAGIPRIFKPSARQTNSENDPIRSRI